MGFERRSIRLPRRFGGDIRIAALLLGLVSVLGGTTPALGRSAEPRIGLIAPAGGENRFRVQLTDGRLGGPRTGDSCSVRKIAAPKRAAKAASIPTGTRHARLFLRDLRRPRRVVVKWHEIGQPATVLAVDFLRPESFDGRAVGWGALISIPPEGEGRMTVRVSWADPADCLRGPDWLVGAIAFERL